MRLTSRERWIFGIGVLLFVIAGCGVVDAIVPRHKWSEEWGPMVPHDSFPSDCSLCHLLESWDVIDEDFHFDHFEETGYELKGGHQDAACLRCHNDRGPVSAYLARGCGGCHVDPHRSSLNFKCTECHDEMSWDPIGLVTEHIGTRFPLIGAHALADCESCHLQASVGDFKGAPVECHLCHQEEARLAQPNHPINGWVRDCDDCHDVVDWVSFNFNHDVFPLEGGHADVDCGRCHASGRIAGTPQDCFGCHRIDYINAPGHVAEGRSTDCTQCHDIFSWVPR